MELAEAVGRAVGDGARRHAAAGDLTAAGLAFIGFVALAAGNGGYFPVAWGWGGALVAWGVTVALLVRGRIEASRAEAWLVVGWALLAAWTIASALWSSDISGTVQAFERDLLYLAVAVAVVVVVRRSTEALFVTMLWAAILCICTYSLATHLFPDRFGIYSSSLQPGRLYTPLGYWNALGIFATMGLLIALGLACSRTSIALRCVAGGSAPVLAATLYFTFSRGSLIALATAIAVVALVCPARLAYLATVLAVAPWIALAVGFADHEHALTAKTINAAAASAEGARMASVLVVAVALAAISVAALDRIQRRWVLPATAARRISIGLLCIGVVALAGVTVALGGPTVAANRLHKALVSGPNLVSEGNLSTRLTSLSLNGRSMTWQVAGTEFAHHPLVGTGAGTFSRYWDLHRPGRLSATYPFSLYLEALGELGLVGFLILAAVLLLPAAVALRRRGHGLVPALLGGYVAFLVHAGADTDWQVPSVVIVAILCAGLILVLDRGPSVRVQRGDLALWACLMVGVGVLSIGGLVANRAVSEAESNLYSHNWAAALSEVAVARRWEPWSPYPDVVAGVVEQSRDNNPAAAGYFREAATIDPGSELAWQGLALVSTGNEAVRARARFRQLDPLRPLSKWYGP